MRQKIFQASLPLSQILNVVTTVRKQPSKYINEAECRGHTCSPSPRHSEGRGNLRFKAKLGYIARWLEEGRKGECKEGILNKYGYVSMRLLMDNKIQISYSSPLSLDFNPLLIFFPTNFLCENNSQFISHTEKSVGCRWAAQGGVFQPLVQITVNILP